MYNLRGKGTVNMVKHLYVSIQGCKQMVINMNVKESTVNKIMFK